MLGNRVVATRVERMAFRQAFEAHPATANETIPFHCFEGVLRTTRAESASRRKGRRNEPLIPANQTHPGPPRQIDQTPPELPTGALALSHPSTSASRPAQLAA